MIAVIHQALADIQIDSINATHHLAMGNYGKFQESMAHIDLLVRQIGQDYSLYQNDAA